MRSNDNVNNAKRLTPWFISLLMVGLLVGGAGTTQAMDDENWTDPAQATIRPGTAIIIQSSACTSNFVFTAGNDIFLGTAAHCFSLSGAETTNGCLADSRDLGTSVTIDGATRPGTLVYSSWITMKENNLPTNSAACQFNDFALIKIHEDDHVRVSPAMMFFGGPEEAASGAGTGTGVITYGNTPLRPGVTVNPVFSTHAREGTVLATSGDGWEYIVFTATPGLPGDSGSGVMTKDGRALGILVTVYVAPFAGGNGITSLAHALAYANENTHAEYELATHHLLNPGLLPL